MLKFYNKSLLIFFVLMILTGVSGLFCLKKIPAFVSLLPKQSSEIPWELETITDAHRGGTSWILVNNSSEKINYDFMVTQTEPYGHATLFFTFGDFEKAESTVDLSRYSWASMKIKCNPDNILTFEVHSIDSQVTKKSNDLYSYRPASEFFNCTGDWTTITVNLHQLLVREWWLKLNGLDINDQRYWLDKVMAMSIISNQRGPIDTLANIQISDFTLQGHNWFYAWAFGVLSVLIWFAFIVWFVREYTSNLIANMEEKLKEDLPFIAYKELTIDPSKETEASRILNFIAREYASPELSLDVTQASLGISRDTISEVLKEELGLSFSAYLNKLRLTEAARLFSESKGANVAEIVYLLGYKNVSHFNRLFKSEFGCTPKSFKKIYSDVDS